MDDYHTEGYLIFVFILAAPKWLRKWASRPSRQQAPREWAALCDRPIDQSTDRPTVQLVDLYAIILNRKKEEKKTHRKVRGRWLELIWRDYWAEFVLINIDYTGVSYEFLRCLFRKWLINFMNGLNFFVVVFVVLCLPPMPAHQATYTIYLFDRKFISRQLISWPPGATVK